MRPTPLTQVAWQAVRRVLHPGDRAIDATIGNGHDALFLARQVAPHGRVIGFDVQRPALDRTRARLSDAGLDSVVELQFCGHERMNEHLPPDWPGTVATVMFNLGYLPGSDKTLITRSDSTLAALEQSLPLLRRNGMLSLLVYRGHEGAREEASAVAAWVAGLDRGFAVTVHESPGPLLYLVERIGTAPKGC